MENKKIAKAIIKFGEQYICFQSKSLVKKWEFFGGEVQNGQTDIGFLTQKFKAEFGISVSIGKKFCQAIFFDYGTQFDVSAYVVNIFDDSIFDVIKTPFKCLMAPELKTLAFENVDKIIMQKILQN